MNFFLQFYRRENFLFFEQRPVFIYGQGHIGSQNESSREFQPEPQAEKTKSRAKDVIYDKNSAQNMPDEALEPTFQGLWKRATEEIIYGQNLEEQVAMQNDPLARDMPKLDADELKYYSVVSETQQSVTNTLYGDMLPAEQIQSEDSSKALMPLAEQLPNIPSDAQANKIEKLATLQNIPVSPELKADIRETLNSGGTIIVDVGDVPIVCGKGRAEGGGEQKVFYLSRDSEQSGYVSGKGNGGGSGKEDIKLTQTDGSQQSAANGKGQGHDSSQKSSDYQAKVSMPLGLVPGAMNVERKEKPIRVEVRHTMDWKLGAALMAAQRRPLTIPSAIPVREKIKTKDDPNLHYSRSEQMLIASFAQDPSIVNSITGLARNSKNQFLPGVMDLLSFRFTPRLEGVLAADVGDDRINMLFTAMRAHLDKHPEAKSTATRLWKNELLAMKPLPPLDPINAKLAPLMPDLELEKCMNPSDWRDLAYARRERILPIGTLLHHFPNKLSTEGKNQSEVVTS